MHDWTHGDILKYQYQTFLGSIRKEGKQNGKNIDSLAKHSDKKIDLIKNEKTQNFSIFLDLFCCSG